jgi:hypothetical protein
MLVCLAATAGVASADVITAGAIRVETGNPSVGLTSFIVSNITGPSVCDSTFNSCTALVFDSAILTVHYLDSGGPSQVFVAGLPDGFGPGDSDPSVFPDFTVDGSSWTLQSVSFSGFLSPAAIFLFGGGSLTLNPVTFSGTFDASRLSSALLTAKAESPAAVPEPSTISQFCIGAGLVAVLFRRSRSAKR